jgi:FKBP-type peptidyl-prolyl cis-trans isomerase
VQKNSDTVWVYYKGSLISGKVFDRTSPKSLSRFRSAA